MISAYLVFACKDDKIVAVDIVDDRGLREPPRDTYYLAPPGSSWKHQEDTWETAKVAIRAKIGFAHMLFPERLQAALKRLTIEGTRIEVE